MIMQIYYSIACFSLQKATESIVSSKKNVPIATGPLVLGNTMNVVSLLLHKIVQWRRYKTQRYPK